MTEYEKKVENYKKGVAALKEKRGFFYGEKNIRRCQHIMNLNVHPFVKRCGFHRVNERFCKVHSFSVSYIRTGLKRDREQTSYFHSIALAEEFRKGVKWTECNYALPEVS